jgi:peptidoglycan/xylan/chitin deacetylase (PgdA/CDA1 family)
MTHQTKPSIYLTFDDAFVDNWHAAHVKLHDYNWTATFFVSGYVDLMASEKQKLKDLQDAGHEIGCHTRNHVDAVKFVLKNGMSRFLDEEIRVEKEAMEADGIAVNAFAYPYGNRTRKLDKALLKHFNILRGTTYAPLRRKFLLPARNISLPKPLVFAQGIDRIYEFELNDILSQLVQVDGEAKGVYYYGHDICTDDKHGKYNVSVSSLTSCLRLFEAMGVGTKTFSHLYV